MVQTPEQRRRNAKFVKDQEARRGKAETDIPKRVEKAPRPKISPLWLVLLGFAILGGLVFEIISRVFFR